MNIDHLITFQRLAREKSFSETAVSLGVSQPTITQRIKEIEQTAGKLLVQRIGQHVMLTDAGEQFLKYVNRTLRVLDSAKETFSRREPSKQPNIRLATISSICSYLLPQFLRQWYQLNPDSNVWLCSGPTDDVLDMINDRIVDLGIVRGSGFAAPFQAITLYHDPICLVVGPEHPLSAKHNAQPISIEQLHQEPIVIYQSSAWQIVNQVFVSHGIIPRVIAKLSHVMTVKNIVHSGMGIAFLPYSTVKRELINEQLYAVPVAETASVHLPTKAVFLASSAPADQPPLNEFIAELINYTRRFPMNDTIK